MQSRFALLGLVAASTVAAFAACSSTPEQVTGPDADGGAIEAGPACPTSPIVSGSACASPGQACESSTDAEPGGACFCVGPEQVWMCCFEAFRCGADPTHPNITVDAPCCPGSTAHGESFGCGWCYSSGVDQLLTCAADDPHWRASTKTCVYPGNSGDSGVADAPVE